ISRARHRPPPWRVIKASAARPFRGTLRVRSGGRGRERCVLAWLYDILRGKLPSDGICRILRPICNGRRPPPVGANSTIGEVSGRQSIAVANAEPTAACSNREDTMNAKFNIALAILAGAALGAAAMQGLYAQGKPKAYSVTET